jgi:hypothetical protein
VADFEGTRYLHSECIRIGKTASKMHEMLKTAFNLNAMGRTQIFE